MLFFISLATLKTKKSQGSLSHKLCKTEGPFSRSPSLASCFTKQQLLASSTKGISLATHAMSKPWVDLEICILRKAIYTDPKLI